MQLQIKNPNIDFKVNEITGEAYVSQRKAAELLGIDQSSISRFCASRNLDAKEGLTSEIFDLCITHYAFDARNPTAEAKTLLKQITKAGVKAYLYHMAGYELNAEKKDPNISLFDSLAAGFAKMAQVEREQREQGVKVAALEERTNAVEARQNAILDQSSYYSVLAYAIKTNNKITTGQASAISRKCGSLSKDLGYTIGTIVDPRFGTVKTYHESVLSEAFSLKGYLEK